MAASSTIVRTLCRASAKSLPRRHSFSLASSLRVSNFTPRQNPIAHASPPPLSMPRLLRRELSSFKPLHTAIASAYLVSKLPSEASTSTEGRFANYLSPI